MITHDVKYTSDPLCFHFTQPDNTINSFGFFTSYMDPICKSTSNSSIRIAYWNMERILDVRSFISFTLTLTFSNQHFG